MSGTASPIAVFGLTAYNGEAHLAEALESLLTQTAPELAVVVVDDCSTDGTQEVARAYAELDPRVVYERNERVLGLARNWRQALELASARFPAAPYFAWASDHDVWHPEWLERMAAELDAHPEAVLAYPVSVRIDDAGAEYPTRERRFETAGVTDRAERLRRAGSAMAAGDMIYGLARRDALERSGPFPVVVLPDRLQLLRLAVEGEFRQVPRRLWYRRYRAGVVMSNRRQRRASFPGRIPVRAYVPWWLAHGLLLARSARSPALGRVVLAGSIRQAHRRRRERAERHRRWRRRDRRRRYRALLRAALGRPAGSADPGTPTPASPDRDREPPIVDLALLERSEVLTGLDRPGAVVLELGGAGTGTAAGLRSRFPGLVHAAASEPERFPPRVDLALSIGSLEQLPEAQAERCVRRLHELGTQVLYSLDRDRAGLREALGRWYWLRELWVDEGRAARKPDPARGPVLPAAGRRRHLVGRRRLRPGSDRDSGSP